jgi:hypothetical protein
VAQTNTQTDKHIAREITKCHTGNGNLARKEMLIYEEKSLHISRQFYCSLVEIFLNLKNSFR